MVLAVVGLVLDGGPAFVVNPVNNLLARELGQFQSLDDLLNLGKGLA